MTTTPRTETQTPAVPPEAGVPGRGEAGKAGWMRWVVGVAVGWAAGFGALQAWFAAGHEPEWELGSGLLVQPVAAAVACGGSVVLLLGLIARPRSRVLIGATFLAAGGWAVACALLLLDLIAGALPGLGVPFDPIGLATRLGGLTGAGLLAATAFARLREFDPACLACIGPRRIYASTPGWAIAAAWIAAAGCAIRLVAQAVVGFDSIPYQAGLTLALFETGFVLAGVLLPFLLVHRAGRIFPRWMLLLPGFGLGVGISAYFGVGLAQMILDVIAGKPVYGGGELPAAFFFVAVPAYLMWGLGLTAAAIGYYLRTRKPCRVCARVRTV